ncbi:hypothetical protein CTAM01_01689 [Colletotrichum tamarilloi]|uniref:Secreted protein n=1 Tax=Colletotrichum tamarilloi TaxID=1209934 RepID=A0ABQ9RPB2_9PEZI|nr:uncharacterized protein CTAM01_01689 [Colletotrichum tamarilloi]KAK1509566.1 hypothetical protein CTAM01_01689 [Colletotrichum tamarilloi]
MVRKRIEGPLWLGWLSRLSLWCGGGCCLVPIKLHTPLEGLTCFPLHVNVSARPRLLHRMTMLMAPTSSITPPIQLSWVLLSRPVKGPSRRYPDTGSRSLSALTRATWTSDPCPCLPAITVPCFFFFVPGINEGLRPAKM